MDANLIKFIENYLLERDELAETHILMAHTKMDHYKCPLHCADQNLYNSIYNAVEEYCFDHGYMIDHYPDEIIFELFND